VIGDDAAQKADLLEILIGQIYGNVVGRHVPISNVRLFTLVFLFDWGCMIRNATQLTFRNWKIGKASPYPLAYYDYFAEKGLLTNDLEKGIWGGDTRVLFQVSFDVQGDRTPFGKAHIDAAQSVLNIVRQVADKFKVDFSKSVLPIEGCSTATSNLENEFDSQERFRQIDEKLFNYVLTLDPFLDNFAIGKELDVREYALRHRESYERKARRGQLNNPEDASYIPVLAENKEVHGALVAAGAEATR
jgi:hypothetical protein